MSKTLCVARPGKLEIDDAAVQALVEPHASSAPHITEASRLRVPEGYERVERPNEKILVRIVREAKERWGAPFIPPRYQVNGNYQTGQAH